MVICFLYVHNIYNNTCWQEALEDKQVEIPAEAELGHVEANAYVCPPAHINSPSIFICKCIYIVRFDRFPHLLETVNPRQSQAF